ncbi:MAG TPA: S-methyl-5-thioribose-1-phosphate isomerase [Pseudonocardiaceae bacterium]|jgi:methylthioribose-1-phosphate isomerase|nr:S-methyl-5-thioribose-1-phosphate isomerase [Pseudonocardiaceae bacterium]
MRSVEWVDGHVEVIDQTALPQQRWATLHTVSQVVDAIHRMVVRGAPALGALGALGVALAAARSAEHGYDPDVVRADARRISGARPTAVHLDWAVQRVLPAVARGDVAVLDAAQALVEADVRACATLSRLGAALLRSYVGDRPMVLQTHCNAGALSCVEWGTALGVVRALHADALIRMVVVGETRPLLQGSRITAVELARLGVPHQVVVDAAGPGLIASGRVDAVIVGADRIAANYDVVNKVGTYPLALAAARAGIPFVVAAPAATLDPDTPTGAAVTIEYRDPDEVLLVGGWRMAPTESVALNPASDVTPADLITAIVTESRVIEPKSFKQVVRVPAMRPVPAI